MSHINFYPEGEHKKGRSMNRRFFVTAILVFAATITVLSAGGCAGGPRTGTAEGASYYVRADGSDRNNGLSEGKPFKTLRKADLYRKEAERGHAEAIGAFNTFQV
jgi:hypothetical protein